MEYKKLIFKQLPLLTFAHSYETGHYHISFPALKNRIEITYIEQGDVVKTFENGEQLFIPASSVMACTYDCPFSAESEAPVHRHSTIGIAVAFESHPVSAEQILSCSRYTNEHSQSHQLTAIIPEFLLIDQYNSNIETLIKKLIRAHAVTESFRGLETSGLILELLAEITRDCVRNTYAGDINGPSPSSMIYSRRAMRYIAKHMDERISVSDIANHLEISAGYLSNTFKAVTGQTIVEYINRVKINKVKELITTKNATLKQAGESVGIMDENYLSRIFKKQTGMNASEYKRIKISDSDL